MVVAHETKPIHTKPLCQCTATNTLSKGLRKNHINLGDIPFHLTHSMSALLMCSGIPKLILMPKIRIYHRLHTVQPFGVMVSVFIRDMQRYLRVSNEYSHLTIITFVILGEFISFFIPVLPQRRFKNKIINWAINNFHRPIHNN